MIPDKATVDLPARKLRIADIKFLMKKGEFWSHDNEGYHFSVGLVWIQGEVSSVSNDKSKMQISDSGSNATVLDCQAVPGGSQWLEIGQYVMAVGLVTSIDNETLISAIKMADLSSNETHKRTWPHEVKEIKRVLTEMN